MEKSEKNDKQFEYEYRKDYETDWDIHQNYINTFDPYEAMLIGQVYDSVSHSVDGSKITDSYAATLAMERAARVMGKLPEGNVEAAGKSDAGKAAFMDILRQKWIYTNANSQHDFKTKMSLWQLYSSVYGYMPMFYDWNVSNTGYTGPDCWLWNPRNLVPEAGKVSITDMNYVTALAWVDHRYIEDIIEEEEKGDGWDRDALMLLKSKAKDNKDGDSSQDTQTARNRTPSATRKGIQLATRYEAGDDGEWITFAPEHGYVEVRRIKNPHKNGRIPFVIKYAQPLYDSFYGLGDFQRAKPLQFARDGLTNFYFKGIKMNLIPPLIANSNGVMKHTLDYREGAVMLETIPNSIRRLETSTAGLATYQGAQTNLTGSLLSQFGSQNASIPGAEALNPSQGKTPAAIEMYSDKEATRDGQERARMESAIEQLTDGFFSLVANIGTEDVPVNLFAEDIQAIRDAGLEDVVGLFDGNFKPNETLTGGELTIKAKALKGADYRFNIVPGSTAKQNQAAQLDSMERLMAVIAKYQNVIQDDPRTEINWGEMLDAYEEMSDLRGMKDFITVKDAPSPEEQKLIDENMQMKEQMQQMQQQMQQAQAEAQANLTPAAMSVGGQTFNNPDLGGMMEQFNQQ